ncbi:uncharacterized protein SPPG_08362 [Spizellomyces punctatus DAOM BR117]|uniref:Uncharacterized protein n=1 Tax=Spizellomyces punctatus (strain DAOM BR117) TaxID=645134 RepID=A0A0L0H5H0_SPIPD|nr:uncharacterized protein SPPG_08362 [Spizellomyces punctatus DAOM BR117]KNC96209.1 hypothetical protein SPPG_08362 [Spizellomyces punctatus DAOM BR117]|eukprot:XP_016604249.1 hypothetical protein SPPG_08362 [Spizellomyces punctatus DAOM BR117]
MVRSNERERILVNEIKRNRAWWLYDFPILVAEEWEVVKGRTDLGVGDLVFANEARSAFLVVEVKALNPATGPTARTSRRKARHEVEVQVERYMEAWSEKYPNTKVYGQACIDGEPGERHGPITTERPKEKADIWNRRMVFHPESGNTSESSNSSPVESESGSYIQTGLKVAAVATALGALGLWMSTPSNDSPPSNGRRRRSQDRDHM